MLEHVVFPILQIARHELLARFSDSQSFTKRQFFTAYWPYFSISLPFDNLNEGDPLELSRSYLVREN